MEKLKPCPFCGGKPSVKVGRGNHYKAIFVSCECGASVKVMEGKLIGYWKNSKWFEDAEDKAVQLFGDKIAEAWNRRADDA